MRNESIAVLNLPLHRPIILNPNNTVKQAAYAMLSNNIGSVLVNGSRGRLIGIVTDRDLAFAYSFKNIRPEDSLDRLVMPEKFIFVRDRATLEDVLEVMREEKLRRVPVVHEEGGRLRCVGIITLDDLIKADLLQNGEGSAILKSQLDRPHEGNRRGPNRAKSTFRHQDRRQHSYFNFLSKISRDTGLSRGDTRNFVHYAMTVILQRITASEGKDLLSQLPYYLQMELMPEISNAYQSLAMAELLDEISRRLNKKPEEAKILLKRFWTSLTEIIAPGEMEDVASQLPRDMSELFLGTRH